MPAKNATGPLTAGAYLDLDRLTVRRRPEGGFSLSIAEGEQLVLLGKKNTGKTALLLAIAGYLPVEAGDIRLDGRSITHAPPEHRSVAYLPAADGLFAHRTLRENVVFGLQKLPRDVARAQADAVLATQGLASVADRRPAKLSVGQRRRGALARALAVNPALLLVDSAPHTPPPPDFLTGTSVTAILATDDPAAAMGLASRIALLSENGLVQLGTPHDLYERPQNEFCARFMGDCNIVPAAGDRLVIRPHRLRLDPAGSLRGSVRAIAYRGSSTRVVVATAAGEMLVDLAAPPSGIALGQEVGLAWSNADAWMLPA